LEKKSVTYSNNLFIEFEDAQAIEPNEEVTLFDWGNIIVRSINKNEDGSLSLIGETNLQGDPKLPKKKIMWIACSTSISTVNVDDSIPVIIRELDYLITKKKLEEGDEIKDFINPDSLRDTEALGESSLRVLNKGDKLQLMRRGYFICDRSFTQGKPMILIMIPDGKARQHSALASHASIAHKEREKEKEKEKEKGKSPAKH